MKDNPNTEVWTKSTSFVTIDTFAVLRYNSRLGHHHLNQKYVHLRHSIDVSRFLFDLLSLWPFDETFFGMFPIFLCSISTMLEGLLMKNEEFISFVMWTTNHFFNNSRFCHKFIIRAHQILLLDSLRTVYSYVLE